MSTIRVNRPLPEREREREKVNNPPTGFLPPQGYSVEIMASDRSKVASIEYLAAY